jgi:hypothetical protein
MEELFWARRSVVADSKRTRKKRFDKERLITGSGLLRSFAPLCVGGLQRMESLDVTFLERSRLTACK